MDLLGLKRKALGYCLLDNWGGSSSNERSSSTSVSGSGEGSTGGGGGTSLGNISSGSSVQSYTYSESAGSFVQDAVAAGTAPGADPNSTQTTLAALSGIAPSAPVVSSETKLRGALTGGRAILSLGQMAAGGPVGFVSGLISLIQQGLNGEFKNLGFGSTPPSTSVSAGTGAAQAAAAWSGDFGGSSYPRSSGSSSYGSPVIGYQGALVNQASPALATANLSAVPVTTAAKASPGGVVIQTQQQDGFPWGGLLLAVGAVALMS